MAEQKPWYRSKIIWFNLLGAGIEIAQLLGDSHIIPARELGLIMGVGNIFLRLVTGQPIGTRKKRPAGKDGSDA